MGLPPTTFSFSIKKKKKKKKQLIAIREKKIANEKGRKAVSFEHTSNILQKFHISCCLKIFGVGFSILKHFLWKQTLFILVSV